MEADKRYSVLFGARRFGATAALALCLYGQPLYSATLAAAPNPILVGPSITTGVTRLIVTATNRDSYSVHVNTATGTLLSTNDGSYSALTGNWVTNGMVFILVDNTTQQTVSSVTVTLQQGNATGTPDGCANPSWTTCVDPAPATYLSGSWIEDNGPSEWTLTADNGSPGGQGTVSGSVLVSPIAPLCPEVEYAAVGSYTPSGIAMGTEGYTSFTWDAVDPNPSTPCGGYTPVTSQEFSGTIFNKGNDTASGTFYNSSGLSGRIDLETNLILTPTSETVTSGGWGVYDFDNSKLRFIQDLVDSTSYDPPDPHNNRFQGRQVYEADPGGGSDGCFDDMVANGITPPYPKFSVVTGSTWNVGVESGYDGNTFGYDEVGYGPGLVGYYRQYLGPIGDLPCTATVPQVMYIVDNVNGQGNQKYITHQLKATIDVSTITVSKDGLSVSEIYP